jgi:predicted membrane protein (TIGR00267 family)
MTPQAPTLAATTAAPASRRVHAATIVRDVILGGQDGLVNVLGLVLGMAAATSDARLVITAGLAAMFAEGIAMAGVAFTASGAERDASRELRLHLDRERAVWAAARGEASLVDLRRQGADQATLAAVAEAIASEREALEDEVTALQQAIAPMRETRPFRSALVVGLSTVAGSAVPIIPFLFLPVEAAAWVALGAAGLVLVVAGVERARLTGGNPLRAASEMLAIGVISALAGYAIGQLLRVPVA